MGESGDEDDVRVQIRYSAELGWFRSSNGGVSGNKPDYSQIITCYTNNTINC